jgi:hypothetical protein
MELVTAAPQWRLIFAQKAVRHANLLSRSRTVYHQHSRVKPRTFGFTLNVVIFTIIFDANHFFYLNSGQNLVVDSFVDLSRHISGVS